MLFSANMRDYPEEERYLRVHHRFTVPFLRLYNQAGDQLADVQKFDSSEMLGYMKDGSTVPIYRHGWVCPNQSSFEMVLRCLPEEQHFLVELSTQDSCLPRN